MNCILAFLFYIAANVEEKKNNSFPNTQTFESRIVFLSSRSSVSHYSVHNFKKTVAFPSSRYSDIFATQTRLDDHRELSKDNPPSGTYVKAYCSFKYEGFEIAKIISRPLKNWSASTHIHFGVHPQEAEQCLKKAKPIIPKGTARTPISLKSLLKERVCDENLIAYLAYGRKIVVGGRFKDFAPTIQGEELDIIADVPLSMENVIYQKEILMEHETDDFHSGLVWYQGHLHLFRLNLSGNGWFAETDLTNEMANGTPIIEHAMQAHEQLKQLKDLWEQLIIVNGEGGSSQSPRDSYLGPKESNKKFRDQITNTLIEKLEARTAKGEIYGTAQWKKRYEGYILGYMG
ncbi:BgTH12-05970 [Blumeria graminis f. sp. triticale]|uniref:BgtAc-30170 n=3 Tax=Blumeria graminis TaxID=34373 RepID=A0A9X9MKW6_BLUGR|nr:hypothetical protein BGT96224_Ac30170 [Blumeria graminis f. sp. tritici 96224]CAD6504237.1 BgTH12-05970 [Blumeria graminis f. sp. triticale]VDB91052.1 BgtAc-30170 [Blumeria graminis f. sp. tritici]